ncbi:ethylene-responsive transcription factor RAP2-4-like protein, partial [Tanacetum coccineum]
LADDDLTEMYSPQFSESFHEEHSLVEEVEEIQVPTPKKKKMSNRRRQAALKPQNEKSSVMGNARKAKRFWVEVMKYMHANCLIAKRQMYDMVNRKWKTVRPKVVSFCGAFANTIRTYNSEAGDADYLQRAMIDYQVEYKVPFTLVHCWEELKECDKWNSEEVFQRDESINLNSTVEDEEDEVREVRQSRPMGRGQEKRKVKAKAKAKAKAGSSSAGSENALDVESLAKMMANEYKSSSSSSFNTRESGDESINLNSTVEDEEDEVREVRQSRPMGRGQEKRKAKAKAKAGSSSAGSENALDVESLAKMMANEYVMASDPYNVQKNQEMSKLLRIKKYELELKVAKLKI